MLPKTIKNIANLIPGTHATNLFRNIIVNEMLTKLSLENITGLNELKQNFGIEMVYLIISLIKDLCIYI